MTTSDSAKNYAAIITITLPDSAECATANIILAPPDEVTVDGRTRRLADCTLADLRAIADAIEADVWETYQSITLLELAEEAKVELALMDDTAVDLSQDDWLAQAIILEPETNEVTDEAEAEKVEEAPTPDAAENTEETAAAAEIDVSIDAAPEPEAEPEPEVATEIAAVEETEDAAEADAGKAEESDDSDTAVAETDAIPIEELPEPDSLAISKAEAEAASEKAKPRKRQRTAGVQLPEGATTWMAVDVLIDEQPLHEAQLHALSSMQREVAGALVGPRPEKQPDGRYLVHVTDSIIAKHTVMQGASVTYTPESWRYLNDELARRYPEETAVIVGWYHTHPGFGIFLSGMDQFIHQNFFTQIWHVALVLDPHARTAGFFCWDRAQTRVSPMAFRWPSWAQEWS